MTNPLTDQQLAEIEARTTPAEDGWHVVVDESDPYRHEIHGNGPTHVAVFGGGRDDAFASYPVEANALFAAHAREDVPALLAEVRRLRAAAETFRALFGNLLVMGTDGNWANVADFIATGARIPACGAFYPPATDTRCYLAKGHRRSHLAEWGTRDMAWPYDPRETVQPLTAEELATAQADVDHLNAEFPDEPTVDQAPTSAETGV